MTSNVIFTVYDVSCMPICEDKMLNLRSLVPKAAESRFTVSSTGVYHYTYTCDQPIHVPVHCLSLYMYWYSRLDYWTSEHTRERCVFRLSSAKITVTKGRISYLAYGSKRHHITPCVQFELSYNKDTLFLNLYVEGIRCGFLAYLRMIVALSLAQDLNINY